MPARGAFSIFFLESTTLSVFSVSDSACAWIFLRILVEIGDPHAVLAGRVRSPGMCK